MIKIIAYSTEEENAPKDVSPTPKGHDLPPPPDDINAVPLADDDPMDEQPVPIQPDEQDQPVPIPEPFSEDDFQPVGILPDPPAQQPFEAGPGYEFETVEAEETTIDQWNKKMESLPPMVKNRANIHAALGMNVDEVGYPFLRMKYTTLPSSGSYKTERTVEPIGVFRAKTGNEIMLAWDHLRNGWRGFVVTQINDTKLVEDAN
jgi:hypothetical protein